jgi:hypothetical protein
MSVRTAPYENKTLGIKCIIQVPVDLENLLASSNPVDVHHAAVKHSFYQGWNNRFRKAMVAAIVNATGFAVPSSGKTRVNRKGETVDILITEGEYIKKVLADGLITETDYLVLGQQTAEGLPFEVSKKEEEAEPDAKFYNLAKQILAMVEAGTIGSDGNPVTEDSFVTKWSAANPGYNFENLGGFTEDGLARALEIDDKRRSLVVPAGLL